MGNTKGNGNAFDCSADNIGLHLKNIFDDKELDKNATTEKISVVQQEGTREVRRNTLFYNLDAIISVGYRVNSRRATQFRQWCTYVLRQYAIRGYVIDKKRMEMAHSSAWTISNNSWRRFERFVYRNAISIRN